MQKIKKYLQQLFKSKFVKDLGIVFSENVITKCLNFVIIIILTRLLGPTDYGKYSFIFVAMTIISAILDFGMENTAVRFYNKEKNAKNSIFGLYFLSKIIILFSVILFFLFFGKNIFLLMNKKELIPYIPFLIIGIIGESLFFINDTYLQAIQKFRLRAIINISRYLMGLCYVILLFLNRLILLKYVFYIYFIPLGIAVFFISNYISFSKEYIVNKISKKLFSEILNYQKWMTSLAIGYNILGRIDFFMISLWCNYTQIGIYNAAFQLTAIVSFLPYVFGKVLLPKMAGLSEEEIFDKTKQIIKPLIIIVLLILCLIPLTKWIVPIFLGEQYISSIVILQILLISFTVSFLTMPFEQAFYSLGNPLIISQGRYLQILLVVLLNIYAIPKYGIISAAINVLITRILFLTIISLVFYQHNKRLSNQFKEPCYEN